jgi:hypothetical protein
LKPLKQLSGLNKADKSMDALCILDVIDDKTSSFGTVFLSCHSIRISSVSASGLKEFYCTKTREFKYLRNMEFEVLIPVLMKIQVLWGMTSCQ